MFPAARKATGLDKQRGVMIAPSTNQILAYRLVQQGHKRAITPEYVSESNGSRLWGTECQNVRTGGGWKQPCLPGRGGNSRNL